MTLPLGPVRVLTAMNSGEMDLPMRAGPGRFFAPCDDGPQGFGVYLFRVEGTTLAMSSTAIRQRPSGTSSPSNDYLNGFYSAGPYDNGCAVVLDNTYAVVTTQNNGTQPKFMVASSNQSWVLTNGGGSSRTKNVVMLPGPGHRFVYTNGVYYATGKLWVNAETTVYFSNTENGVNGLEFDVPYQQDIAGIPNSKTYDGLHVLTPKGLDNEGSNNTAFLREDDDYWYITTAVCNQWRYYDPLYGDGVGRNTYWPAMRNAKIHKRTGAITAGPMVLWQSLVNWLTASQNATDSSVRYYDDFGGERPDGADSCTWGFHQIDASHVVVCYGVMGDNPPGEDPTGHSQNNWAELWAVLWNVGGANPVVVDEVMMFAGFQYEGSGYYYNYDPYVSNTFMYNGVLGAVTNWHNSSDAHTKLFEVPVSASGFGSVTNRGAIIPLTNSTRQLGGGIPITVTLPDCAVIIVNDYLGADGFTVKYVVVGSGTPSNVDVEPIYEQQTISSAVTSVTPRFLRGHDI